MQEKRMGILGSVGKLKRLLRDRNVIMILAVVIGFIWPGGSFYCKSLTLPALAVVMTLSTMSIAGDAFLSFRNMIMSAVAAIVATYVFHGGLLLLLNTLFIHRESVSAGFVLLAAVPPAVAVIPFALFLNGDANYALVGTVAAYLGALVITPLIAVLFLGSGFVDPFKVLITLVELIITPLFASRVLRWTGTAVHLEPWRGTIINWSFFLVIYVMVGLNRAIFLKEPIALIPVIILALASTFGFGFIIEKMGNLLVLKPPALTSLTLLGTCKNYGLAGALSLVFFGAEAAIPATVSSVVGILYIVYLELRSKRA
jgi:bile acid:Na+ symporter, BASS family